MSKYTALVIASALILCACGKKSADDSSQATKDTGTQTTAAKEIPYRDELERGLAKLFNYLGIPRGDIEIMSQLSSEMEAANPDAKRFSNTYIASLQTWQKEGLAEVIEKQQSQLDLLAGMGTRRFTVTPTKVSFEASDKQLSTQDWVFIPCGICRIKTIVKDVEYHHAALPVSDDFRLIVGTYERSYNDFAKKHGVADKPATFKFRAVIKLNPFNHTYSFRTADWGLPAEDEWKSANVGLP